MCCQQIAYSYLFFFFSSRRRHTRLTCDWSSDVCSSDLDDVDHGPRAFRRRPDRRRDIAARRAEVALDHRPADEVRVRPVVALPREDAATGHLRALLDLRGCRADREDLVQARLDAGPDLRAALAEVQQRGTDGVGRKGGAEIHLDLRHLGFLGSCACGPTSRRGWTVILEGRPGPHMT